MMISTHHDGLLTLYWREQMWLMNYSDSGCYTICITHTGSLSLQFLLQKKSFLADCNALQLGDDITIKTSDWLKGDATFDQWKAGMDNRTEQSNEELRQRRLVDKYARIWRLKTIKGDKVTYCYH